MYIRRETRAERTVRVAGAAGLCVAGLVLWWWKAPDTRDVSGLAEPRNFAVAAIGALVAARDAAAAQCAQSSDREARLQDEESAFAAAKLASAALAKISLPEAVRTVHGRLDGRLGYAKLKYDQWATKCDPAAAAEVRKYDEDLTIDLEAFRNPTGIGAGGIAP